MGEYAIRKSDKVEVKIGTCERMYYLRYENRNDVIQLPNSLDPAKDPGLVFRLPFPDEDHIPIGAYKNYCRGIDLIDFRLNTDPDDTGIIQLTHPSGLLINVPCHHGNRLPELGNQIRTFWNGKATVNFQLVGIKDTKLGILPVVSCKWCHSDWSLSDCDTVLSCVSDDELRFRLEKYASTVSRLESK